MTTSTASLIEPWLRAFCAASILLITATPFAGAQSKKPFHPDVLGIKLGVTQVGEVQKILSQYDPKLKLDVFDNGYGVQSITGLGGPDGNKGFRHSIAVNFAAIPGPSIAVFLSRTTYFLPTEKPLESKLRESLVQKYGVPGFERSADKQIFLHWAWTASGDRVSLDAKHLCVDIGLMHWPRDQLTQKNLEAPQKLRDAGCAAVVHASVYSEGDLTSWFSVYAADILTGTTRAMQSIKLRQSQLESYERQRLDDAARRAGPKL